jgi:hypothetical protein
LEKEPGHNYNYNKKGMGIGKKSDFMAVKPHQETPAPDNYINDIKTSTAYQS